MAPSAALDAARRTSAATLSPDELAKQPFDALGGTMAAGPGTAPVPRLPATRDGSQTIGAHESQPSHHSVRPPATIPPPPPEPAGSASLGVILGLLGGPIAALLAVYLAKGTDTRRGVAIGYAVVLVASLALSAAMHAW